MKKVLGLLICLMMLMMIPVAAGLTVDQIDDPEQTDVGRTILRGFIFNYRPSGFGHKFFALRVHYTTITGTERSAGTVLFKPVEVGREAGMGFNWVGPAGMLGYMFGATFKGGITY